MRILHHRGHIGLRWPNLNTRFSSLNASFRADMTEIARVWNQIMIRLTRLNHVPLVVNSDLIEHVENAPDTVIFMTTGQKYVVLESPDVLIEKIREYRRSIGCGWRTPSGMASSEPASPEPASPEPKLPEARSDTAAPQERG